MVEGFLERYFKDIKEVGEFHFKFLMQNKFVFPKINYLEVKRFIDTATNFLLDIDPEFLDSLGRKMKNDIEALYNFYKNFKKKVEFDEVVFYQDYLQNLENYKKLKKEYIELKEKLEKLNLTLKQTEEKLNGYDGEPSDKEELLKYKKLKKIYVDTIYEISNIKNDYYSKKEELEKIEKEERLKFIPKFRKYKEQYLKQMQKVLSCKLFYYDKLLWYNARNSNLIQKFFRDSDIQGDFSTKTFIGYFLKNIDELKANDAEWIMYLKKLSKVIE